jgi:hypothetical protein
LSQLLPTYSKGIVGECGAHRGVCWACVRAISGCRHVGMLQFWLLAAHAAGLCPTCALVRVCHMIMHATAAAEPSAAPEGGGLGAFLKDTLLGPSRH